MKEIQSLKYHSPLCAYVPAELLLYEAKRREGD